MKLATTLLIVLLAVGALTGSAAAFSFTFEARDTDGGPLTSEQLDDLTFKVEYFVDGAYVDLTPGFVAFDNTATPGDYFLDDPRLNANNTVRLTTRFKGQQLDQFGALAYTDYTTVYDAINGNATGENVAEIGAATVRLEYEYLDVNVFAVDPTLAKITDPTSLGQLSVSVDGAAAAQYDQDNPSVQVLRGESVVVDVFFAGQELTGFGNDGGIAVANGVTKAYEAVNGNAISNPTNYGTAILIQYDLVPLNIFAVDTSFDLISDQGALDLVGVSINGGAISSFDQGAPSISVLNGSDIDLKVYYDDEGTGLDTGDELTGFTANHGGGIGITSGLTEAYKANDGNGLTVPSGKEQGTALLIQYDIVSLNLFAVDPNFDLISDSAVLDLIGVSVNGGTITSYNQASSSLSMLNGEDVFVKVYFDDEGTGLDPGDELLGFTGDHSGGIGVTGGVTEAYDGNDGNTLTVPGGKEQGTAILIRYNVVPLNIFAVDSSFDPITDPATLGLLGISVSGGAITPYDQSSPTLSVLNGEDVFLRVYFDDEANGLDSGDELAGFTADHSGGIGVTLGETQAYVGNDGNGLTVPGGKEQGSAILIQYDVLPLNIFAVDTAFDPISDQTTLGLLGISVNGNAITAYNQTAPTISVINGNDVDLKVYFDDEADGVDAGDELVGFTSDHAGGIGIPAGITQAYGGNDGNTLAVPAGKEQGTAILIQYDVVPLQILAVDYLFDVITDQTHLDLIGVSVNGGAITSHNQSGATLSMLGGDDVSVKVYFDDEGDGLDAGDELTGFTEDHAGGIGITAGQSDAYDAKTGNPLTVPAGKEQGSALMIHYDILEIGVFAVDINFEALTDPSNLSLMGVGINGNGPIAYDQTGPTTIILNGSSIFVQTYFDDEGDGLDAGDQLSFEDQAGGIPMARGVTKAYEAVDGNPLPVPPGSEQGSAILLQYDVVSVNVFAVDMAFDPITDSEYLGLIGVSVNGGAIQSYDQVDPTIKALNTNDVFVKVYFDDEADGVDAGDELLGFTSDHTGGIGMTAGETQAYDANTGNTLSVPAGKEQGTALLLQYDLMKLNIFAVDSAFDVVTDSNALALLGVGINGSGVQAYTQGGHSLVTLNGSTIAIETYFDDEGDGLDPSDQLSFEDQAGGIPAGTGLTKAYDAIDGDQLTVPAGKEQGSALLIQYDILSLNVFAVGTTFDLIADQPVLDLLGVSINNGGIVSFNQAGSSIAVLDGNDVFMKVYFDDEGDGLDAGDELTGFTEDHTGGIGITGGQSQAYDATTGNPLAIPAGKEQGTAVLIHYDVLQLNVFAVDLAFDVVPSGDVLNRLGVSIDGGTPVVYDQVSPSIITLDGSTIAIATYYDEEGDGFDAGDMLSFEDQSGGIVVAQDLSKAYDAVDGNPLVVPGGKEQGAAILIQYDVVAVNIFAVDTALDLVSDPGVLSDLGVSVNGGSIVNFIQAGPTLSVLNQDDVFLKVYFDNAGDGFDPTDELTGFTEDHAGGIGIAAGLTQAYDSVNGNPIVVPPGKEQGTAILVRFDVIDLSILAATTNLTVIQNPTTLARLTVEVNGVGPGPYIQTGPTLSLLDGQDVFLKVFLDGVEQTGFTEDHAGGIGVADGVTLAFNSLDGNPIASPPNLGTAILIGYDVNSPPIADAGEDRFEPCFSLSKHVELDGSGSYDPDGDPLTYTWMEGETILATGDQATAEKPTILLSIGVHTITLTVEDPIGEVDSDDVVITVGDVTAPAITITSHVDGEYVPKKNTHISGTIVEGGDLVSAKVNGHGSFTGNAPDFTFSGPTSALQPDGPHVVTVVAKDLSGNEGTATITLNVDTTAPDLDVLTPTAETVLTENPALVTVTGTVSDAGSGVASVLVNDEPAVVSGGTFSADVTVQGNGKRRIRVVATDNVGHETKVTAHVTIDTLPPRVTISIPSTKPVVGQTSFLVTGRALDSGRGVQSVMVQFDQETPVAATLDSEAETYSVLMELPEGTPNGEYTVSAVASDGVLEATAETSFNLSVGGNDPILGFAVKDHLGNGLQGVRVDLLKASGSGTGERQNTNGSGEVSFLVDPAKTYLFKVYYRGGTWTSSTPVGTSDPVEGVNTELSVLTLTSSTSSPIEGARVDLLRANGSNTGVRGNTDGAGEAAFEVLPGFGHQFKVYYNGGSEISAVVVGGEDTAIQTELTELTLTSSTGSLIDGARVDLLRNNNSGTGIRENTSNGVATFEVLPSFVHRFKVYHNGGSYVTGDLTGGADTSVQTELSQLTLSSSSGPGIEGVRVDLLRSNGSNTGIRVGTDASGVAPFEVLPGFGHSFKVYHNGGTAITAEQVGGGSTAVSTIESEFTLTDSGGAPIEGARVDLLRSNRSNTGVRTSTDASGVAVFEVLEGYRHRFRVYYNGGDFTTEEVVF